MAKSKYDGRWNDVVAKEHWRITDGKVMFVHASGVEDCSGFTLDQVMHAIDSGIWFRCDENGKRIEGAK